MLEGMEKKQALPLKKPQEEPSTLPTAAFVKCNDDKNKEKTA